MRLSNKCIVRGSLGAVLVLCPIIALTCMSIAFYSEAAYEKATSLKVESLSLMGMASEQYAGHQAEVEDLKTKLEKAYEYAKGRPKNEISAQQWRILIDPNRNLLGGFLKRWEQEGTLSKTFVKEAKRLIADAFDTIIGLETGKIRGDKLSGK